MKAIVLLSGGLDSTLLLAKALEKGRKCLALSFDYGQRHRIELDAAQAVAKHYRVPHRIIRFDTQAFGKSCLVGDATVPKDRSIEEIVAGGICSTYVPARNTLFLAYALGQAELWDAQEIHIGSNRHDYNGFPDCRPLYMKRFQALIDVATEQAVKGSPPQLVTPLVEMEKGDIAREAFRLDVPIGMTWSCYDPTPEKKPCHRCDACVLRDEALGAVAGSS